MYSWVVRTTTTRTTCCSKTRCRRRRHCCATVAALADVPACQYGDLSQVECHQRRTPRTRALVVVVVDWIAFRHRTPSRTPPRSTTSWPRPTTKLRTSCRTRLGCCCCCWKVERTTRGEAVPLGRRLATLYWWRSLQLSCWPCLRLRLRLPDQTLKESNWECLQHAAYCLLLWGAD